MHVKLERQHDIWEICLTFNINHYENVQKYIEIMKNSEPSAIEKCFFFSYWLTFFSGYLIHNEFFRSEILISFECLLKITYDFFAR